VDAAEVLLEQVLEQVDARSHERGQRAGADTGQGAGQQAGDADERGVRRHMEQRAGRHQEMASRRGAGAGERDRDEAARLPLEEQELDGKQHGGQRRAERCRHPGRRARHQ
jgi:hypothetical protein